MLLLLKDEFFKKFLMLFFKFFYIMFEEIMRIEKY